MRTTQWGQNFEKVAFEMGCMNLDEKKHLPLSLVYYRAFFSPHVWELEQYSDALLHNIFLKMYHKDIMIL